jgi:hypothetical protein
MQFLISGDGTDCFGTFVIWRDRFEGAEWKDEALFVQTGGVALVIAEPRVNQPTAAAKDVE